MQSSVRGCYECRAVCGNAMNAEQCAGMLSRVVCDGHLPVKVAMQVFATRLNGLKLLGRNRYTRRIVLPIDRWGETETCKRKKSYLPYCITRKK